MKETWIDRLTVIGVVLLAVTSGRSILAAHFAMAPSYATGTGPCSVAVGDLNGDGKLDLVVANNVTDNVSVLLGNGDGTFQSAVNYVAGTTPSSVAVADFNRDGKSDIVVANAYSNSVSVLLANGDGTFQSAVSYNAGTEPLSVAVGDFNGDQMIDLAVADQATNSVSVLLGNGDGTFKRFVSFAAGTGPTSVAAADFNGDGRLDLAVADGVSNAISVLLGNGDGTFKPAVNYGVGQGSDPLSVVAGDFNGDGKPDLAVANNVQIWVSILLNKGDGTGTFLPAVSHEAGTFPTAVAVGDFNGDGKLDLAVSNNGSNTLTMLMGNGDGTLKWVGNWDGAADVIAVAVGDFNCDGKLDAVVANELSYSVSLFLGNGDGTVVAPISYGIGGTPQAVAVGAFAGQGVPELVASNGSSGPVCTPGCVSVIASAGNGTFKQYALNYNVGTAPKGVAVGDFDADGNPDIVAANTGSSNVSVLLNTGAGDFGAAQNYAAGTTPVAVAVGDFNGDNKLDLAVVNAGDNDVSILIGNGDGSFQGPVNYAAGTAPTAIALGDLNGDGKLDLAITNGGTPGVNSTVSVLLGNGDGTFRAASSYTVGVGPTSVAIGDFNGDGKQDLAVADAGPKGSLGTASVLLGNGDGTFQAATSYSAGYDPLSIGVADMNGDGDTDIVVADGGSAGAFSGVSVLLGKGDGSFQAPAGYAFGNIADAVAIADLNGDGAPDLAVTSINAGVTVLLNPGGTFMTAASSPNPSSSGQSVTFTVSVTPSVVVSGQPAPTGTVVFNDGQTAIGPALSAARLRSPPRP